MRKSLAAALVIAASPLLLAAGYYAVPVEAQMLLTSDMISTSSTNTIGTITSGSNIVYHNGYVFNSGGQVIAYAPEPSIAVAGAIYHQVVDNYYDRDGNKLKTASATHTIGADCQPGLRRNEELTVMDDGNGQVRFAEAYQASEPRVGVKPMTFDQIVKVTLSIPKHAPVAPELPAEAPRTLADAGAAR